MEEELKANQKILCEPDSVLNTSIVQVVPCQRSQSGARIKPEGCKVEK